MADLPPIIARSADGVAHRFPAETDIGVIDSVMKTYAEALTPKAAPAPEPVSGTALGVAKAGAQDLAALPGGLINTYGNLVSGAATASRAYQERPRNDLIEQVKIADMVDRGVKISTRHTDEENTVALAGAGLKFARTYAALPEEDRAAMRKGLDDQLAAMPKFEDTLPGQITSGIQKQLGPAISAVGKSDIKAAQTAFPLTPEEEGRPSVIFTKLLTGLAPYLATGAAAGLPAVVGYMGAESFGKTYDEAKAKGFSDEDATGAAAISGLVQGGLGAVPIGQAMHTMAMVPKAFRGEFIKTAANAVASGGALLTFSQVAAIADNAIAKDSYDPNRSLMQGVGEHMGLTFLAGATLPLAGAAMGRAMRAVTPSPKILDAPTVDQAIDAAKTAVSEPVDVQAFATGAREYGGQADQQQAKLLQLFDKLGRGTVEQAQDGGFHLQTEQGPVPLKVWDERAPRTAGEPTIPPTLAAAQRDHYGKMGLDVVYFQNDARIPFDGAVDPQNPNTLFLSSNPERNAAQVAAHEVAHALEATTLPDGTSLGDLLQEQVQRGMTAEGRDYAIKTFGVTAPKRIEFPATPEGYEAHWDAVEAHLVRELGADIGGEAPKFQTFAPKVIDAVQQRYGFDAARDVLAKFLDGIRQAMRTLREFFSKPEEHAEYGQPETVSQNWVTNLGEVHDTLAKMYAERFGTQAEKENAALLTMRNKAERDRFLTSEEQQRGRAVMPEERPAEPVQPVESERPVEPPEPAAPQPAPAEPAKPAVSRETVEPVPDRTAQIQREQAAVEAMRAKARGGAQTEIGKNASGETLFEDARGVRSFIRDGVRITEPVGIKPGSREISIDRTTRPQFKLASELAPATREPSLSEHPGEVMAGNRMPPVTPEARPETSPERIAEATHNPADHRFAEEVADMLEKGTPFNSVTVQSRANRIYGGSMAEGAYSRDRIYDAIELGVNRFIQRHPERFNPAVDAATAKETAEALARVKDSLPTQTVRAGEKDAYQQFSTPPDYAYAANWIANLRPTDHVLEPSAGVGGLIVHAMNAGVRETTVNELSDKRRGMIEALKPTRTTGEDAAQLHNILPGDVRPTVVVMNPPFSRSAERMGSRMVLDEGAKHIEQALARLEPGGRLVAIVGDGMKPEGTAPEGGGRQGTGRAFRDWWNKIGAIYDVRANVGVDRDIYKKYGTSFPTRFLVIDKNAPSGRPMVTGQARDAADLIDRLQEVRNERGTVEPVAGQPGRAPVAAGGENVPAGERELPRPTGGSVGTGEERGERPAPDVAEPAGAAQPAVGGGVAAGGRPAGGAAREPVVPVESEPGRAGAGREPGAATAAGEGPAGSGADRGRDGIRPDGSGEREQPGVTPAPEDVIATENAVARPDESRDQSEGVSEAIYENYRPQRIQIVGAKAHPGALVQSAAMASVLPPKTDYKPRLPAALIKSGALSDAQLEAIVYAGHAHSDVMPNGKRRGFFIGDGTGVGKGREIAGILLDNKQSGRTKAVWVSEKRALLNDAKRDWNGLGQPATEILDHGKTKAGDDIAAKQGILFTTYDTLKSAEQTKTEGEKVRGRERVDQIVDWLGKDFDGVIAFDESHNLGNAVEEKGKRGTKKAALKALAGVALQDKLPNARVIYVSATGATEVGNLAYADRLGLWGEGTSFANRQDFVGKVSSGGMAAMELVARDMKALGHYIARSLSYDGVSYDRVEHVLSKDQRETYDKLAEGWQVVLQNFTKAMQDTGITGGDNAKTLNGKAKSAILSAFWGGHQRFFNQVITSMQMPSVIRGVEADLKAGRQAVLQLVNTMEAAQERALEKARKSGEGELEDLDMTPRDQLMQLVEKSFPVQQMESYVDDNGNLRSRPAVDSKGNPILNREAVAARDRLLDELGSIRVPDGPLEMLLNHFGTDKVAEVTGRGQRVVRKPDETGRVVTQVEKRGAQANVADSNDFQAGNKPILIFSEAGGTGRSYHAAIGSGSEDARRSHYLVQGGWRADKAVQGFGRTHRTNQASAPIFHLVTTDLQGQKRFISSIARRLGQLGALTKGERRTGDQGMFGMRDNLESTEARDGLTQFFRDVSRGEVEGVTMDVLEKEMGLKLRDESGGLASPLPEMSQFLNRVLSLTIDRQNRVFEAFSDRMDQAIDRAAAAGTLDTGVEAYKADKISKVSEQTVYTDPRSGAETKHLHLLAQTRNHPVGFEETLAGRNKTNGQKPDAFVQNVRSERVFAVTKAGDRTDSDGRITSQVRLTSPIDYQLADRDSVNRDNWKKLKPEEAKPLWDQQVAATPEYRNSALHLITGAVLPIWDRIGGNPKIYRLQTDTGERMLGRVIPSTLVDATLERLGAEGLKITETPGEIAEKVLGGATARLANEWTIKSSRVAGEPRLELVGPDYRHGEELARHGIFSERISYQTRYFIPTEPGAAAKAIEAITKTRPVTSLQEPADAVKFSPKQTETPEFKRWFGRSKVVDPETGKPGVVYHGTTGNFDAFSRERLGEQSGAPSAERAFFFTSDTGVADSYAAGRNIYEGDHVPALVRFAQWATGGRYANWNEAVNKVLGIEPGITHGENIMPVYVSIKNPLVYDFKGWPVRDQSFNDLIKLAEQRGADGLIFKNAIDPGYKDTPASENASDIYVAFHPEQIKSAIGNRGTFDAANPDIRMSPKREEPFYSALTRGVEGLRLEKATPGQWEGTIRNLPGVKPEERAWVGLDDWLRAQPKSVSKADVLDYLRANEIKVQEVVKGGTVPPDAVAALREWVEANTQPNDYRFEEDDWRKVARGDSQVIGELEGLGPPDELLKPIYDSIGQGATKFGGHVLPGGENYRELLLTLPEKRSDKKSASEQITDLIARQEAIQDEFDALHKQPDSAALAEKRAALAREKDANYQEIKRLHSAAAEPDTNFHGSHWDEPNVLAHIRFDERTTSADGTSYTPPERTLHVAEIQSDLHQTGRKKGYKESAAALAQIKDRLDAIAAERRSLMRSPDFSKAETAVAFDRLGEEHATLMDRYNRSNDGVPDAPFKTTWPELAFKRILRYAAEHNYDRVSWDTGSTNADRFDLSQHIDEIRYSKNDDGTFDAAAYKGDDQPWHDDRATAEVIANTLGKEIAEKIVAGEGAKWRGVTKLSGLDLKVGGEGMAAFYDKQLPIIANKIGKKFGAKVEETRLNVAPEDPMAQQPFGDVPGGIAAHSIAITDAMREGVMQGQPLFSPKLTPDERQAVERVFAGPGRTMAERYAEAKQDAGRKFVRGALDPYIGIKTNDPAGYLASRMANSSAGAVRFFREGGTLRFEGDALASKDLNGGAAAFEEALGPELPRFLQWVVGNRADRLKAEDRENLLSADDIKTFKGMNKGNLEDDYTLSNGKTTRSREAAYVDALGKLDALNKNLMELNVEAGNVKKGVADALLANPFYVPFYRVAEEDGNRSFAGGAGLSSGMVKQSAWKKLTGGTNKLADPWTNWTRNAEHMIEAAMRNRTANKVLDTAETLGSVEKVTLQDYNHTMTKGEKADTVWTNVDGEKQYWRVHDPMVLSAVSALNTMPSRGVFMQVGRGFAKMLRYGVTSNPIFAVRNLIRDTENSMAVSEISKNPFKNLYDGFSRQDLGNRLQNVGRAVFAQELERRAFTREEADALAGGAMMRLGGWNEGVDRTTVLDTPSKLGAFGRYLSSVAGTYKEAVGIGEDVNRLALYKQLRQEGASHAFAAFSARDLQDFTLKGAWQWVRTITEITPFMNARAQGLYKIGRAASDADRSVAAAVGGRVARNLAIRTATVLGAMTLAGLALDSIWHDDEDYKKRTEYDRQTYYWFKVGDAQFRIPKGFELAALSSMAADGIEAFFDKEMTGRRLVDNFWLSLGTNLQVQAPAILQPAIDIGTNTRGTGGPIEGMGMERLRPEDRFNQSSTLIARGVSSALNAAGRAVFHATDGPSPVQIDYLANAYGGWLATNVLGMADTVARSFSSQPVEPAKDFWSQATQGLVSTEPRAASRYVDLLYKQGKEVEQAYASYRDLLSRGQGEEAQRFFKDNQDTLQKHGLVSGLMRLEGDLNRQIRLISNNPDPRVTAEQKKIQIMQLQSIKSRAAEQVFGARP